MKQSAGLILKVCLATLGLSGATMAKADFASTVTSLQPGYEFAIVAQGTQAVHQISKAAISELSDMDVILATVKETLHLSTVTRDVAQYSDKESDSERVSAD